MSTTETFLGTAISESVALPDGTHSSVDVLLARPRDHNMLAALRAIASLGGNLPDDRLTDKTGPNDAERRGLMYVEARRLAREALALATGETPL